MCLFNPTRLRSPSSHRVPRPHSFSVRGSFHPARPMSTFSSSWLAPGVGATSADDSKRQTTLQLTPTDSMSSATRFPLTPSFQLENAHRDGLINQFTYPETDAQTDPNENTAPCHQPTSQGVPGSTALRSYPSVSTPRFVNAEDPATSANNIAHPPSDSQSSQIRADTVQSTTPHHGQPSEHLEFDSHSGELDGNDTTPTEPNTPFDDLMGTLDSLNIAAWAQLSRETRNPFNSPSAIDLIAKMPFTVPVDDIRHLAKTISPRQIGSYRQPKRPARVPCGSTAVDLGSHQRVSTTDRTHGSNTSAAALATPTPTPSPCAPLATSYEEFFASSRTQTPRAAPSASHTAGEASTAGMPALSQQDRARQRGEVRQERRHNPLARTPNPQAPSLPATGMETQPSHCAAAGRLPPLQINQRAVQARQALIANVPAVICRWDDCGRRVKLERFRDHMRVQHGLKGCPTNVQCAWERQPCVTLSGEALFSHVFQHLDVRLECFSCGGGYSSEEALKSHFRGEM